MPQYDHFVHCSLREFFFGPALEYFLGVALCAEPSAAVEQLGTDLTRTLAWPTGRRPARSCAGARAGACIEDVRPVHVRVTIFRGDVLPMRLRQYSSFGVGS